MKRCVPDEPGSPGTDLTRQILDAESDAIGERIAISTDVNSEAAMKEPTKSRRKRTLKDQFEEFANRWAFHLFVTLQFNDARNLSLDRASGVRRIRGRLREWDARIARETVGRHWSSSPDRPFSIWVPEKVESNPHWHGLVRIFTDDPDWRVKQVRKIVLEGPSVWRKLVPSGTCEILPVVDQPGVVGYLAKSLPYNVNYEHVIYPDEFFRG